VQENQGFSVTDNKNAVAVGLPVSDVNSISFTVQPQLVQVDTENYPVLFRAALDLYETTFTDKCEFSREELEISIKQGKHNMLVLPNGSSSIKGFATIGKINACDGSYCLLDYFTVAPEFRGNGFGGKFFKMVIEYLSECSPCKVMLLECEQKLITWYEKNGAVRTQVPPSLCSDKLFYLMAVSIHSDPMNADGNGIHRDKAALFEIRRELHQITNCREVKIYLHDGQVLECLIWTT
jgi:ribosomal protein S18 acetylase RimI-like enzyme